MNFKFLFILSSILLLIFPGIIFKQWRLLLSIIPLLLFLSDRRASCNVHIERIPLPQRVIEGTKVEIVIKFQADSHPSFTFEVFDALPSGATIVEGSNRGIFSLKEKEEGKLRYVVELTRGHHVFGPLTFLFSNISGTHTEKCVVEQTVKTIVLTRFEEVRVPVLPKRHRSTVGIFPSRFVGRGREFFSVRNYYWGDEQRIINWKATARTGKLKSNDYESERAVDALIVVDAREEPFGQKVLDYSLAAALSCAYFLLREKNRIGLLIFSDIQYYLSFDYGKKQFLKMADALSGVTSKGRHPFRYVMGFLNRLPRSCLVVLISPLLDSEMEGNIKKLSSFSHQLFIVSPSPLEAEAGTLAQTKDTMIAKRLLTLERRILLKRLSRHALVVDWDTTSSLGNVLGGLK